MIELLGMFAGALFTIGILTRLVNWILAKYNIDKKKAVTISDISVGLFGVIIYSLNTGKVGLGLFMYMIVAMLWLIYDLNKIK